MDTMRSTVKWFDARKGYGFILHPDGGADIFVHYTQIRQEEGFRLLRTGQEVEFVLEAGPKGMHAHEVSVMVDRYPDRHAAERVEASMPMRDRQQVQVGSFEGKTFPGPGSSLRANEA